METQVTQAAMEVDGFCMITIQKLIPPVTLITRVLISLTKDGWIDGLIDGQAEDLLRYGFGVFMLISNIHDILSVLYISILKSHNI